MATYVLIHGAGGSDSWYWHLVAPGLRAQNHEVVAPDLPSDDEGAGWPEYATATLDAVGDRDDLIVVGQSLGAFTAPLLCGRAPVQRLVLVAGMVPLPGESPEQWFAQTGWEQARREQAQRDGRPSDMGVDPMADFFHDVPAEVVAEAMARGQRPELSRAFGQPWPLAGWPEVPTAFVLCRHDRFFPAGFMRKVVDERLGVVPEELDSGHLPALARPRALTDLLIGYVGN